MEEKGPRYCTVQSLGVRQILSLPLGAATNPSANDSKGAVGLGVVVHGLHDLLVHRDLHGHHSHACVEMYIGIRASAYRGLTLLTNDRGRMAFCTFYVCVKNFHYQTCPQPWDLRSSNYPYQGYLKINAYFKFRW